MSCFHGYRFERKAEGQDYRGNCRTFEDFCCVKAPISFIPTTSIVKTKVLGLTAAGATFVSICSPHSLADCQHLLWSQKRGFDVCTVTNVQRCQTIVVVLMLFFKCIYLFLLWLCCLPVQGTQLGHIGENRHR